MQHIAQSLPKGPLSEPLGEMQNNCPTHGEFTSVGTRYLFGRVIDRWTRCPGCKADEIAKQEASAEQERRLAHEADLQAMLGRTSIPARFLGKTFDSYEAVSDGQLIALDRCRSFAMNFEAVLQHGSSLVLSGYKGTGKSHLACAILQAILPRHVGMFVTFGEMIRMLRDSWGNKDAEFSETEVMRRLTTVPLLVIDEVGVQRGTITEHNQFFEVMDARYRAKLPNILLTNELEEGFRRFVGDRVFDRLQESFRWVACDWESYRTRGAP